MVCIVFALWFYSSEDWCSACTSSYRKHSLTGVDRDSLGQACTEEHGHPVCNYMGYKHNMAQAAVTISRGPGMGHAFSSVMQALWRGSFVLTTTKSTSSAEIGDGLVALASWDLPPATSTPKGAL